MSTLAAWVPRKGRSSSGRHSRTSGRTRCAARRVFLPSRQAIQISRADKAPRNYNDMRDLTKYPLIRLADTIL
eukprot:7440923-Pyramimonas_sp.AAC.1